MTTIAVAPMRHTGDSANLAYYRERGADSTEHYIWAEVLCSRIEKVDGEIRHKAIPNYYITVMRNRRGRIARFTYTPKSPRSLDTLPARTVTKLVREALSG